MTTEREPPAAADAGVSPLGPETKPETQSEPQSGIRVGADSLETLIERNLRWLRGWFGARLRGVRRQDAEDLCQEVLLRVVRGSQFLRAPEKFSPWLYRIANNVLRDYLRKQQTRSRESTGADIEAVDPRDAAEDKLAASEELDRTVGALLELPRRYREPMLLRHVDDLSYAEIGRLLSISENAVQVRIFRARKMLRHALESRSRGSGTRPYTHAV